MKWFLLITWCLLWATGGLLLVRALFRLPRRETWLVGFGVGLVTSNWLVNWLARILDLPLAAWVAAGSVFLTGIAVFLALGHRPGNLLDMLLPSLGLSLALFALTSLFMLTGRGLGIFDDYQNLPTVSLMAAGDIPPHFALNPDIRFGYHYFLLLLAAQGMRLGGLAPWSALDLARSLVMAVTLLLAGFLAFRLTRSQLAQWTAVWFVALSGGIRWLLLLAPAFVLTPISNHLRLLGSAAQTGETFAQALTAPWNIEGAGTVPFPFAFVSGINQPLIMVLGGFGVIHILLVLLLLLVAGRERKHTAMLIPVILLAALALSNEVTFITLYAGLALIGLAWVIARRNLKIPASLVRLAAACLTAFLLAIVQGGMFTEIASRWLAPQGISRSSYFEVGFHFVWPPQFISAHLGSLQLTNLAHLVTSFLEIGPVLLVSPLLFAWGWQAFKRQKWIEAGLAASALVSLLAVFFEYQGTAGISATTRLYGNLLTLCTLYAIPLTWIWAQRRGQRVRTVLWAAAGLSTFGGSVLLGVQLLAAPRPVPAPFVTDMDRSIFIQHWNSMDPDSLVFDPVAPRSPTIFGRPTRSHDTWYSPNHAWAELVRQPDPRVLQEAGFDYIYVDKDYRKQQKQWLDDPCVRLIQQVDGTKQQYNGAVPDFRQLLDIRSCR
jgi:hypothetical protein